MQLKESSADADFVHSVLVLDRARKNRVRTSASLLASESMTRPSQARVRAQFPKK
jgi:hypothetical protein